MYDPSTIGNRDGFHAAPETPSLKPARLVRTTSMGVCLGASTVSVVWIARPGVGSAAGIQVLRHSCYPHEGDPRRTLLKVFGDFDPAACDRLAVTGRRLRESVRLSSISEPEAAHYAYRHLKPDGIDCPAIVSAGGETFMAYILDASGSIVNVVTGNKCASGTGEFFLQQLRRMDVSLADAGQWSGDETPYPLSGRCSVFCKSDCTHATNKGIPRSRVAAGLCRMMAQKILDLLRKVPRRHIMLVGGTARNRMMVAHLQRHIDGLIVPDEAPYFEALGTAIWALEHPTQRFSGAASLFVETAARFERLKPLGAFSGQVTFKTMDRDTVRDGDRCIVGLDVGSTTTKAVLLRQADKALLASIYLRTNGDPVGAARACYAALLQQLRLTADPGEVPIVGLGVCGSGRQIAGLHAGTDAVINEIVAHATAAVHFDPSVETIFEIGGQDAKYTHITAGVASDYAMNEACSAGTGSFLEESARETLGIAMADIAEVALKGSAPPNFNDQCAAFIASDIKTAIHEDIGRESIVAGLVYSICMNYANRVKGNRPMGRRIFMQGGVCYNRAVPMAMAALVGRAIVVPPEPGLMGAFGVALEVDARLADGRLTPSRYDLHTLEHRQATHGRRFICRGGRSGCDRGCEISVVHVEGRRIPFGGACNRYYNLHRRIRVDVDALDRVKQRQMIFRHPERPPRPESSPDHPAPTVGINRSFLFHTYFPLYAAFFNGLGADVRVPDRLSDQGIAQRGAAFCYPAELAHGYFHRLIDTDMPPDFLFLPHFKAVPAKGGASRAVLCPFVQGESYFLQTTFRNQLKQTGIDRQRVLSPVLDMAAGLDGAREPMVASARKMGFSVRRARQAFDRAVAIQDRCTERNRRIGQQTLDELADDPRRIAVVIFGRPYNAWTDDANMGIPRKLASRGIRVLPLDSLPLAGWPAKRHMYWGMGQRILQAARRVAAHPQLFGAFITNFSCGPDSFIVGYFRDIMGAKPSLTLELDSHTADAGLETRIEAFLDVVAAWRHLQSRGSRPAKSTTPSDLPFRPARCQSQNGQPGVTTSDGNWLPLTDPRVHLLFPSMGRIASEALAAAFAGEGIRSTAAPPADAAVLKKGRANTSCKECLPLQLTTGSLLTHLEANRPPDDVLVYFMATGGGPCRFGQYRIFMEDLIRRRQIGNVALFSLDSTDGYGGVSRRVHRRGWQSVVISDVMEDIRSMLLTNAAQPDRARQCFETQWTGLVQALASGHASTVHRQLDEAAGQLRAIALRQPVASVPVIALVGEIFVRRDGISRQFITERLAQMGFACVCAPVAEWLYYTDWLVATGRSSRGRPGWLEKWGLRVKNRAMAAIEVDIHHRLARSGLVYSPVVDLPDVIRHAQPHLDPDHHGEAILTVGSALKEVATRACGVIAIGPFGCMPNRLAESILSEIMTPADKLAAANGSRLHEILTGMGSLPFLAIESDGSPFPQIITAKLEAFCLQAGRLHARMRGASPGD
ncbi:acyl-CoA dehydratase activase [Desulfosarcina ovata]|uniref:2-hydroxyglutaryl-CoA dehydratase n=1 Tax=Desulfosarcina ovata subsp. ovata TaxID=2752305 RepID=A0A5K8AB58_9BACT|nr:acyl-CoA dehydratase activase [Desulfosarcina ovata]BBO89943.1 2-hydroxyglutaryl-CoA dehydratase [Desulfosarcina ovata subsp. ovata]